MGKYEKDLDVIASRLKNASDLLKCFLEFCDEEENTAGFLSRLETQKALIESAVFTMDFECDILNSLSNKREKVRAA
ncbi:MAG: hypothetical protein J6J13_03315 [Clostridia bacterium]|nr:hypothetical protein [Clostridia bacterium]